MGSSVDSNSAARGMYTDLIGDRPIRGGRSVSADPAFSTSTLSRHELGVVNYEDFLTGLRTKIFADGADLEGMRRMASYPWITGFTTNPTLMLKAGVVNYERFARHVLDELPTHPVSFEILSDEFEEMRRQALKLASLGQNVYVKVPITTTAGDSCASLIRELNAEGVKVNVTAVMQAHQVRTFVESVGTTTPAIISVFAGRVADTGRDPVPLMRDCLMELRNRENLELLWASPREVLNLVQAEQIGCHIITMTNDLLAKLNGLGRDLDDFSLDTVRMFYRDARAANLAL